MKFKDFRNVKGRSVFEFLALLEGYQLSGFNLETSGLQPNLRAQGLLRKSQGFSAQEFHEEFNVTIFL
jgi:hypothetical protein